MILNGVSAWIATEKGKPLAEYETKQVDENTIEYVFCL
jgi:hypothetical protein